MYVDRPPLIVIIIFVIALLVFLRVFVEWMSRLAWAQKSDKNDTSFSRVMAVLCVVPIAFWFLPSAVDSSGELVSFMSELSGSWILISALIAFVVSSVLCLVNTNELLRVAGWVFLCGAVLVWAAAFLVFAPDAIIPRPQSYYASLVGLSPALALLGFLSRAWDRPAN
jgi:hypothetical protein